MNDETNIERNKLNAEGKIMYDLLNDHKEFSLDQNTVIDVRIEALHAACQMLKYKDLPSESLSVETLKLTEKFKEYILGGVV